jgi:DnaJ like chaperone protein
MYWRGKLMGFFCGLLIIKSPFAALIGFLVGHYFDKGLEKSVTVDGQQVFIDILFSVMGYIAKSDGHVSERELQIARDIMERLYLTAGQRQEAMLAFSRGKQPDFDLDAAIQELQVTYVHQPKQLKLFFTLQMQAANEDGFISLSKQRVLQEIGQMLGIIVPFRVFNEYASHQQYHHRHQYQRQQTHAQQTFSLNDDYVLLNSTRASNDAEIKKAYRKLMSQHHPDKLSAKGLSPEKIKQATEKTQQIKAAYDRIRASRGM